MTKTKWLPEGYHQITPYLIVNNCAKALDFYKTVFNAEELMRMPAPNGKIGHAEMSLGDSKIMMADESSEMEAYSPTHYKGTPVTIHFYVSDVDSVVKKAVQNGAKIKKPIENQFYGDRAGSITDPFGHHWYVSTHVEDVTPEEIDRRLKNMKSES